jgi:hypothetical protein
MTQVAGEDPMLLFRREQSPSLGHLFKAWAAAKLEPDWHSEIHKNATAQYGGFVNMAGLIGATEKALAKHQLVVNQTFLHDSDTGPLLLVTEIGHGDSGEFVRSILPVPRGGKIQEQKSAITYMRRAGYEALLGLAPADSKSDDDGDAANRVRPPDDPGEARRLEMLAKQKIGAAKTKDELVGLVARVQSKFETGELPQQAVDRLMAAADEKRRSLSGE